MRQSCLNFFLITNHFCRHYITISTRILYFLDWIVISPVQAGGNLTVFASFSFKVKSNSRRIWSPAWYIPLHQMGKINRIFLFVFNIRKYVAFNRFILFWHLLYYRLRLFMHFYKKSISLILIYRYWQQCTEQTSTYFSDIYCRWH